MESDQIKYEFNRKVQENYQYKIKGSLYCYKILSEYGVITGAYAGEEWEHKEKLQCFSYKDISNAIFPSKTVFTKEISFFRPHVSVYGLVSGVYHVYMRHGCFDQLEMPEDTEIVFYFKKGEHYKQLGYTKHFTEEIKQVMLQNDQKLISSYLATLDLSDFSHEEPIQIKVSIAHTRDPAKKNWILEGVLFVPAASLDFVQTYILLQKDKKHIVVPEDHKTEVKIIEGKPNLPVGYIERDDSDQDFAKERLANIQKYLQSPYKEEFLLRPADFFSLDSSFYQDIEHCKFNVTKITRRGNQSGTYPVFVIVKDENDDAILNQPQQHITPTDFVQVDESFLEDGYDKAYFNWAQMKDDQGKAVRALVLETKQGQVQNLPKCKLTLDKLLWVDKVPEGKLIFRWYLSEDGEWLAVITVE